MRFWRCCGNAALILIALLKERSRQVLRRRPRASPPSGFGRRLARPVRPATGTAPIREQLNRRAPAATPRHGASQSGCPWSGRSRRWCWWRTSAACKRQRGISSASWTGRGARPAERYAGQPGGRRVCGDTVRAARINFGRCRQSASSIGRSARAWRRNAAEIHGFCAAVPKVRIHLPPAKSRANSGTDLEGRYRPSMQGGLLGCPTACATPPLPGLSRPSPTSSRPAATVVTDRAASS